MSGVARVLRVWMDPALSPDAQAMLKRGAAALVHEGARFAPVALTREGPSLETLSATETRTIWGDMTADPGSAEPTETWFLTGIRASTRPPFTKTSIKVARALGWHVAVIPNGASDRAAELSEDSYDLLLRQPPRSEASSDETSAWARGTLDEMHAVEGRRAGASRSSPRLRRPVLSICVSTYNRGAWLAHSLPLILEQAAPYRDIVEVVVCDNASTDDTPAIAESLGQKHKFHYHRNVENVGMLGNLGVSCDEARGEFVWVIGDDDLMVEGSIERVLSAVAVHPRSELIYTNYAFTHFDGPEDLDDVGQVVRSAKAISAEMRDQFAEEVSAIAAKSENCFTAIYCLVFRRDHAERAYHQDTSGKPFSSLLTSVPTAYYVCRELLDRPGYWIGDPCVVVNLNVSWRRYASLFILERFPELFDLMQERGVDAALVDGLRSRHVPHLPNWFHQIYLGKQRENLPLFSAARLVGRFGHLPAFRRRWPELQRDYRQAFARGTVEDPSLTPERLEKLFSDKAQVLA